MRLKKTVAYLKASAQIN